MLFTEARFSTLAVEAKVLDDAMMQDTADSILQFGIPGPVIMRPDPDARGRFEALFSGSVMPH